jgi:hypothetical protein
MARGGGCISAYQIMGVAAIFLAQALLYLLPGLTASFLFLEGSFGVAFILTIAVTQGWRSLSETLRADYLKDTAKNQSPKETAFCPGFVELSLS